jgi:hypothetical protein
MNTANSMNYELTDVELEGVSAAGDGKVDMSVLMASTGATCPKNPPPPPPPSPTRHGHGSSGQSGLLGGLFGGNL